MEILQIQNCEYFMEIPQTLVGTPKRECPQTVFCSGQLSDHYDQLYMYICIFENFILYHYYE